MMDDDDLMHYDRLKRQVKWFLENPGYGVLSASMIVIHSNGDIWGPYYEPPQNRLAF